ncbi:MAG: hypothetical protein AAF586_10460 [Planctomycetota bacterium]
MEPAKPEHAYWFPARRYGWGWGAPATWQGWAVLLGHAVLLVGGAAVYFLLPAGWATAAFASWALVLTIGVVGVCLWKGEPPRWRWGD